MTATSSEQEPAGTSARCQRMPAAPLPEKLAGLDDRDLLAIARSLPRSSERRDAACELLVSRYRPMVRSCARQYRHGPEPTEELMQLGYVGLLKAINGFDPAIGASFAAYARPCITGEIKRHFRDKRWQIHVSRPVKELVLEIRDVTSQLTHDLGREPTDSDLAAHLGITAKDVQEARRAEMAYRPSSLDAPLPDQPGPATLANFLGQEDPRLEHMLAMQAVAAHWRELPPREQKILVMRFRGDMTQVQIGQQLGLSQMQISRLLAHAYDYLRPRVLGLHDHPASIVPAAARHPRKTHGSAIAVTLSTTTE
jgi:RNA polymerase sigma-B factor